MEADPKKIAAIRLSQMIQGVGEGRDVSDQEVVDQLLKTEEKSSLLVRWADAAISFFLPRAIPAIKSAKPSSQSTESQRPTQAAAL